MTTGDVRFPRNAAASADAVVSAPPASTAGSSDVAPHAPLVGEIDDAPLERKTHHPFLAELRRNHAAQVALAFLVLLTLVAIFAPLVAPYDPNGTDIRNVFRGPWSDGHLLGTDHVGRDILSRLIFGARTSLVAAVEAVAIATAIGVPLGLIAGYFGGPVDSIFSRMNDALTSVPALMLALTVVAVLGPGLGNAMIAVGIVSVPRTFRVTRAAVLEVRHATFIEASVALGLRRSRVVLVHVLPNAVSPLLVIISVSLGFAVLAEAALSYLGFGVQPPTPSWGGMLSDASRSLNRKYLVYAPGVLLALTIAAFTVMADVVRKAVSGRKETDRG